MTWFCYNCPELRWIYVDMYNMNINVFFVSWFFLSVSVISIFLMGGRHFPSSADIE